MWIIAAFDIPSEEKKAYRRIRKTLISLGFQPAQKSIFWRWEDSPERVITYRRRFAAISPPGDFFCIAVPDANVASMQWLHNGEEHPPPELPAIWVAL